MLLLLYHSLLFCSDIHYGLPSNLSLKAFRDKKMRLEPHENCLRLPKGKDKGVVRRGYVWLEKKEQGTDTVPTHPFILWFVKQDEKGYKIIPACFNGWFPTNPTVLPFIRTKPMTIFSAHFGMISNSSPSSATCKENNTLDPLITCLRILISFRTINGCVQCFSTSLCSPTKRLLIQSY